MVHEIGGSAVTLPVVPDNPAEIEAAVVRAAAQADVVVVSAGSSAGSADHTAGVVGRLGRVVVHGVATRPGKPAILGYAAARPALGMPGYPVSAWLTLDNFLRPLLGSMLGVVSRKRETLTARLARRMPSPAARLGRSPTARSITPTPSGPPTARPFTCRASESPTPST